MFELTVDSHFSAAHYLKGYDGDCARMHGHTWGISVTVRADKTDELGMCLDFKTVSATLDSIICRYDHQTLNDLDDFSEMNPTAENLARLVSDELTEKFDNDTIQVYSVTVSESDRYRVTYYNE